MDIGRFDSFTRSFGRIGTRRGAIGTLAVLLAGISFTENVDAKRKQKGKASGEKKKKKCVKDGNPCPTGRKKKCCTSCNTTTNTCGKSGCVPDPEYCRGKCGIHPNPCGNGNLDCGPSCDAGKTCNTDTGVCEDAGGICPADVVFCSKTPCETVCSCAEGLCSSCAVYLKFDPTTDADCTAVGLPMGTKVGDGAGCTPRKRVCLTPCKDCVDCGCINQLQSQVKSEGFARIVGFMPLGGKHRKR